MRSKNRMSYFELFFTSQFGRIWFPPWKDRGASGPGFGQVAASPPLLLGVDLGQFLSNCFTWLMMFFCFLSHLLSIVKAITHICSAFAFTSLAFPCYSEKAGDPSEPQLMFPEQPLLADHWVLLNLCLPIAMHAPGMLSSLV